MLEKRFFGKFQEFLGLSKAAEKSGFSRVLGCDAAPHPPTNIAHGPPSGPAFGCPAKDSRGTFATRFELVFHYADVWTNIGSAASRIHDRASR